METMTMTQKDAIVAARKEVVLVRVGGGARINTWDHDYKAWVEGREMPYSAAQMEAADEIVRRAIQFLLPDLNDHIAIERMAERRPAATRSGFESATVRERVSRAVEAVRA
jgi:hypothetical protein